MQLLTIGAFAAMVGLTPKALRLYDEIGLLPPAAVDPDSGYRLYEPDQVHRARLIASMRRIGMPLTEIDRLCGLPPEAAAVAVEAYWRRVTADTAARGRLATLLVDLLSGRSTMSENDHTLQVRATVRCETGSVRHTNEDRAYAGDRLLAVADGMRGPGGAAASAAAIDVLTPLETVDMPAAGLLSLLADAVGEAERAVRALAVGDHQPVTTLTALLRSGAEWALVHVGDTRAYLLRDGELSQLTRDHTYVQTLVDQGRLGPEEVAGHPQRTLLTRALGGGGAMEADLALRTAVAGDRYLLCSDGLAAVVDRSALHETLRTVTGIDQAAQRLLELAYAAGAPDNVTCLVADLTTG